MGYREDATTILELFMDRLKRLEAGEMVTLTREWETIALALEDKLTTLSLLKVKSNNQLYQEKIYQDFLLEVRTRINLYTKISNGIITNYQTEFARLGLVSSQTTISLIQPVFHKLPVEAINAMIGLTQEGTPLFNLLQKSYPQTIKEINKTLLESIALGRNPRETARLLRMDMDGNLTRALRIARTEQMQVFREASRLQMKESGVLKGYELIAEPDACELCQSQTGKLFEFNEEPDLHPNCRCAFLPFI